MCDTVKLEEMEVRLAAMAPAKERLAEEIGRMKWEVAVKVPRGMDLYKYHLKEDQMLGEEHAAAEVKRLKDKAAAVAGELERSEADDAAGRLDDAAEISAAGAKLVEAETSDDSPPRTNKSCCNFIIRRFLSSHHPAPTSV